MPFKGTTIILRRQAVTAVVVLESRTHFAYPTMHIYSVLGVFVLMNSSICECFNINKTKLKSQELNVKY